MSMIPRLFSSIERDLARTFRTIENDPFFRGAGFPSILGGRPTSLLQGNDMNRVPVKIPNIDVSETKDAFLVEAEVPGFAKDQISIEFKDDTLTLKGKYEVEKTEGQPPTSDTEAKESASEKETSDVAEGRKYWSIERQVGSFERSFAFPASKVNQEEIKAAFDNGLLKVKLPKLQQQIEEKQVKRIAIE